MSLTRTATVLTPSGIHARPAATFVETAKKFTCLISMESRGKKANCKSLISVLKLGVPHGATVQLTADGPDEAKALDALVAVLAAGDSS